MPAEIVVPVLNALELSVIGNDSETYLQFRSDGENRVSRAIR